MVSHSFLTLALTSLAAGAAIPADSSSSSSSSRALQSFNGQGQLRTRWNEGDHADLGCLTDTDLWTANDALCGTFTGAELTGGSSRTFSLSTAAGACYIYGTRFECGQGNTQALFGIWPFPNSIPGVDCLRIGQYGLMASSGRNPPLVTDAPQEIHLTTYSETGKYVWLTWGPVA